MRLCSAYAVSERYASVKEGEEIVSGGVRCAVALDKGGCGVAVGYRHGYRELY